MFMAAMMGVSPDKLDEDEEDEETIDDGQTVVIRRADISAASY